MADHRKPAGPDDTPAIFDQMDALMARHRGSGPDQSIPVLREIAVPPGQRNARNAPDAIPVLTQVESMIGDDFMFSPEEIHPPEHEPEFEPPPAINRAQEAPPAASQGPAATPAPSRERDHISMLDAPLLPEAPRRAAPVPPPPEPPPAPKPASFDTSFDFPLLELDEPAAKTVAAPVRQPAPQPATPRPPVAAPAPPPVAHDEPFMPELALNFDFTPPTEEKAKPPAVPIVTSMANSAERAAEAERAQQTEAASRLAASSGYMSAPTVGLSIELAPEEEPTPVAPPAMISMESQTVGLRIEVPHAQSGNQPGTERRGGAPASNPFVRPPAASAPAEPVTPPVPAVDPAVLANELMVLLKPHLEKMVRVEMSRQIASIHSAAIKNVLSVLQPKLGPLVAQAVRQVLSKRS